MQGLLSFPLIYVFIYSYVFRIRAYSSALDIVHPSRCPTTHPVSIDEHIDSKTAMVPTVQSCEDGGPMFVKCCSSANYCISPHNGPFQKEVAPKLMCIKLDIAAC